MFNFSSNIKLLKFFTLIIFQILTLNISNIYSQNPSFSSDFKPKIVGGIPAKLEGNEHMVSIRSKAHEYVQFGSGHYCGGSLIAPNLVLTTANCLIDQRSLTPVSADLIVVVMGALKLNDRINSHIREVNRVTVHEKFIEHVLQNDIGLLHLNKPFELSSSIKIIPYAQKADYSVGQSVDLAGWGATVMGGDFSPLMMTTTVKIVSRDECKRAYRNYNDIIDTMFCAADKDKDSCQGDTGGPLVLKGIQYGIISWGKDCGNPQYPGVYTDVPSYADWIARASRN